MAASLTRTAACLAVAAGGISYGYSRAGELGKLPGNMPFYTPAATGVVMTGGMTFVISRLSFNWPRTSLAVGLVGIFAMNTIAYNNTIERDRKSYPTLEKRVDLNKI